MRLNSYSCPSSAVVVDADGLGLDGDAPLALQVHAVEHLLAHVPLGDGVGHLQDAVGQRGLPVVDVGDDAEIADVVETCHRRSILAHRHLTSRPGTASAHAARANRAAGVQSDQVVERGGLIRERPLGGADEPQVRDRRGDGTGHSSGVVRLSADDHHSEPGRSSHPPRPAWTPWPRCSRPATSLSTSWPTCLPRWTIVRTDGDFDVNAYFGVLTHLSVEPGWVIDYLYQADGMGGRPFIYARPADRAPYASFDEYAATAGGNADT